MTDEEKEAIKSMQEFAHSKNGGCVTAKEMQIILNMLEKRDNRIKELEEALKKKDKIIDAMSDTIETSQYANIDNTDLSEICCYLKCKKECNDVKKECIKKYFEKEEV